MLGKKKYLCKMQVECMTCGKVILSENQQRHIEKAHNNKVVKYKIYNDAKQPKLMFPIKARIDDSSNNDEPDPDNFSQMSPVMENTDETSDNNNEAFNNNDSDPEDFNENPDNPEFEDQNKIDVVSSKPNQPVLEKYNPKDYDCKRDFQSSWYKKHPWINYNLETHIVTCFPCKKFLHDESFSFDNWKRSDRLTRHSNSEKHLQAMIMWLEFNSKQNNQTSVLSQLSSQHSKQVEENRKYLKILIENVAFLSKQNISFRGHRENRNNLSELSDVNRGNFLELLSMRSEDSSFLKEKLDKSERGKMWTSYLHQNELIQLLSKFTEARIVNEINTEVFNDIYVGIISDETSDISRNEQISLVISYVDSQGRKKESFLGFIETPQTDGETLFNLISEKLKKLGISPSCIVGLGFDGASNMSGVNKGVAARFKELSPMSTYVHCYGHILNLAIKE